MCDTVAAQLVGHEPHGFLSLTLQQSAKESPRCTPVPTGLYEDVDQWLAVRDAPALAAMRRLAAQYPRYGYRRIRIPLLFIDDQEAKIPKLYVLGEQPVSSQHLQTLSP